MKKVLLWFISFIIVLTLWYADLHYNSGNVFYILGVFAVLFSMLFVLYAILSDLYETKQEKKKLQYRKALHNALMQTPYAHKNEKRNEQQVTKKTTFTIQAEFEPNDTQFFTNESFLATINQAEAYAVEHNTKLKRVFIKRVTTVD